MGAFAVGADPSKYYTPYTTTGPGISQAYVDSQNAERRRQAELMAQQIAQASATTSGMNAQASAANTAASNLANLSSNLGSVSSPNLTGGSYSLPGLSTGGGISTGGSPAGGVSISTGTTSSVLSPDVQAQYDPWSRYRAAAGDQLAIQSADPTSNPATLYQNKLAQMTTGTFGPDDPSYQWRFNQGQQAVERSLAAKGLLNSGNAAIELQQYGQGAASQEYQAQFQRMLQGLTANEGVYNDNMNRLMTMAGVNLSPTAGGELAVAAQNANSTSQNANTNAAQVAGNYDLGMRELLLKQYLGQLSSATGNLGGMSGTNWSAIFGS